MAKGQSKAVKETVGENSGLTTREDVQVLLDEIQSRVANDNLSSLHTLVSLNTVLRLPNAREILDDDLKAQARDLWLKVKASGVNLTDPPILFNNEREFIDGAD